MNKSSISLLLIIIILIVGIALIFQSDTPHSHSHPHDHPHQPADPNRPKETVRLNPAPTNLMSPHYFSGLPKGLELKIIKNIAFTVGFDEKRKNPAWVAYQLSGPLAFQGHERISGFKTDERSTSRVTHKDYTHSGFSRGHMAPSFAIFSRFGKEAQRQTYVMTNVIPQYQSLNGGPWQKLEARVARDTNNFAKTLKSIWVVTGPIYDDNITKIPSNVEIPDACFKILVDVVEATGQVRMLAFAMPNTKDKSALKKPLATFLVTVDSVEAKTGLDFFSGLEDEVEDKLEGMLPVSLWGLN